MGVHFISGKPGGGKTLYSVMKIVEELRLSNRMIVTNVALNLQGMAEYLHKEYGETFWMDRRIVILDESEASEFYLYYGRAGDTKLRIERKKTVKIAGKDVEHWDYSERMEWVMALQDDPNADFKPDAGCLFVIDEIHEFFNSRKWQDTGIHVLHYLSQHRKLTDDVLCITQSIQNVEKQFTRVAQDFTTIRNHGKESLPIFGGLFRSLPIFGRSTYLEPYTGMQTPVEFRTFRLDVKGIASCYNTAAGVGIIGRAADTKQGKRSGLSPAWLILVAVLAMGALFKAPDMAGKAITSTPLVQKNLGLKGETYGDNYRTNANSKIPRLDPNERILEFEPIQLPTPAFDPRQQSSVQTGAPGQTATNVEDEPVYLTGLAIAAGRAKVMLSDGRTYTNDDRELEFVGKNFVIIEGRRYNFAPRNKQPLPEMQRKVHGYSQNLQ